MPGYCPISIITEKQAKEFPVYSVKIGGGEILKFNIANEEVY